MLNGFPQKSKANSFNAGFSKSGKGGGRLIPVILYERWTSTIYYSAPYDSPTEFSAGYTDHHRTNAYPYQYYTDYTFSASQGFYFGGSLIAAFPASTGQIGYWTFNASYNPSQCVKMTVGAYNSGTDEFEILYQTANCNNTVAHNKQNFICNVVAPDGTYPNDGYNSADGFYYVKKTIYVRR